ncbi:tetratricopeptide repeat-containing sensor histidine kinase [Flavobacterium sp.]|uniref:tetratricopeptide repeat-containing sensor histidine kinase n=1 Tax=Flavobacterium sp. TaxID=239 RepID=UPI002B4B7DC3|nr:tetratricopeptide repeat-containing sensor histidine kinase [Flavobacterium sp.]HLP63568.1 tetratricopeptide repeat-containing sensor histidine kinase [Flavobacterium sp.]
MRKLILLPFLFFSMLILGQTNSKKDSLEIKKMIDAAEKISVSSSAEGVLICNEALQLAKAKKYFKLDNYAYNVLGRIYSANGKVDESKKYFDKAISLSKKYNDKAMLCSTYCDLGSLLVFESKHLEAIHYFTESLKIAEEIKLDELAFYNLYYISDLYIEEKNLEKSFEYSFKALAILKNKNDRFDYHRGAIYDQIGKTYNLQKDYTKAKQNLEKSLLYYKKIKDDFGIANSTYDLYKNEYDLNKNASVDELISKIVEAHSLFNSTAPESRNNINCLNFLAELYLKKGDFTKALNYANQSKTLCKQTNFITALIESNRLLSAVHSKLGDYKKAYEHQLQFNQLNDSLFSQEHKNELAKLESKKDIIIRDKQLKINAIELKSNERQKWFLICGLVLLGVIGGLLLYQNRSRKRNNELLQNLNTELDEANKAKTRFFSILNHDLRSPVSNLIDFLHLQKDSPDLLDEETKSRIEQTTLSSAENLLTSMEDILQWSKSQMENFKPQPKSFAIEQLFEDTKKHFSSVENIQFQFENSTNLSIVTDENYLKTIVRNLTGNAIKALADVHNPAISWKAFQENGSTYLSITDNGKGATDEEFKALYDEKEVSGIKSGLGLHLIRDLAKAIDCKIEVASILNQGTVITLLFQQ